MNQTALLLAPQYRDYVWGGERLRPGHYPTAEAWVVYEHDLVTSGSLAGKTLGEAAAQQGEELLGRIPIHRTGLRFPLLIKLLDCAKWLSLQVHPNDELARRLEGEGFFGKTEAWHFFEADPGAEILCGLRPGTQAEQLAEAIRQGSLLDYMQRLAVQPGDSIFIRPGMIHALGPGLLLYEVQQTSDLTYRVWDWNRPSTPQRPLHIEKSLAVADPNATGQLIPALPLPDGGQRILVSCPYFTLAIIGMEKQPVTLDTKGDSFHALTVIRGQILLEGQGWSLPLGRYETALVPAGCGAYQLLPIQPSQVLRSFVE